MSSTRQRTVSPSDLASHKHSRRKSKSNDDYISIGDSSSVGAKDQDSANDHLNEPTTKANPSLLSLLPLLLALLPAFMGVLAGEPVGILFTDIVLLFVLGWVLWTLSEGMWTLHKSNLDQTRVERMIREFERSKNEEKKNAHVEQNRNQNEPVDQIEPTDDESGSELQVETVSPSVSSEPEYFSQPAKSSIFGITLLLYIFSPVIGGLILHYSRSSLSVGTKLVNSFNIFLYIALEMIRNINRLSTETESLKHLPAQQELISSSPSFIQYQKEHNHQHHHQLKLTQEKIQQEIETLRLVGRELNYVQRKIGEFDQRLIVNETFLKEELYSLLDNIRERKSRPHQLHHTSRDEDEVRQTKMSTTSKRLQISPKTSPKSNPPTTAARTSPTSSYYRRSVPEDDHTDSDNNKITENIIPPQSLPLTKQESTAPPIKTRHRFILFIVKLAFFPLYFPIQLTSKTISLSYSISSEVVNILRMKFLARNKPRPIRRR